MSRHLRQDALRLWSQGFGGVLLAGLLLAASQATAYPEFVRDGYFSCVSCHVSPSGGGALTDYGRSYSAEKLATWSRKGEEMPLHGAVRKMPSWLVVGANIRQIQTYVETKAARKGQWLAMQRDFDLCLKKEGRSVGVWGCLTGGLLPRVAGEEEEYGLRKAAARIDMGESFIFRAGRFYPRFGLMIANHTASIRQGLGFVPGVETDQAELTYISERVEITAYNDFGRVVRFADETQEDIEAYDPAVGLSAALALGSASRAGISYRRLAGEDSVQHSGGLFAAIGLTEDTYILAEADQRAVVTEAPVAGQPKILRSGVGYFKVGHAVKRGVVPYIAQDIFVPDLSDGYTRRDTYGLGLQWYPRPHFEVDAFWGHVLQRRDFSYATSGYLILHYYL